MWTLLVCREMMGIGLIIFFILANTEALFKRPNYLDINDYVGFSQPFVDDDGMDDQKLLYKTTMRLAKFEKILAANYHQKISNDVVAFINEQGRIDVAINKTWNPQLFKYMDAINSIDKAFRLLTVNLRDTGYKYMCVTDEDDKIIVNPKLIVNPKYDIKLSFRGFKNILGRIRSLEANMENRCLAGITISDQLFAVFNLMAARERKRFIIFAFEQKAKLFCNNESNFDRMDSLQKDLVDTTQQFLRSVISLAATSPRDIYHCQIPHNQKNSSYFELERYQQRIIMNDYDMMADHKCSRSCSKFQDNPNMDNIRARKDYCSGRLVDCTSSDNIQICEMPRTSSRRYQWVRVASNSIDHDYDYVDNGFYECHGTLKTFRISYKNSTVCEPCICTCIDDAVNSPSRYKISLKAEVSDISKNEVITGIKFVLSNRVIYGQIQTGILLNGGKIDESSVAWKPVNEVDNRLSNDYDNSPEFAMLGANYDYDVKYINLTDIYLHHDRVVTGFQFKKQRGTIDGDDELGGSIGFKIQATKFDYFKGRLLEGTDKWVDEWSSRYILKSEMFPGKRTELKLKKLGNPLMATFNLPSSKNPQFIRFQASDWNADSGQSTIPFFDSEPVSGSPVFPLNGIGLFHKGQRGFGGFLGFRIMGINTIQYATSSIVYEH